MSTKSDVLFLLKKQQNKFVSGQQIADVLKLSRTSIWKAIKALEEDGYLISAVRNLGYRLRESADIMTKDDVLSFLDKEKRPPDIRVLKTVDSTNDYAKKLALCGEPNGSLVLAEEQTSGRGRNGKSFYSPEKTGLYMSVLLRPDRNDSGVHLLTLAAAVAVCETIEKLYALRPRIKWVNDIYLNGKKICGILSEAGIDLESGGIEYVVIGIGINCTTTDAAFPEELRGKAGSIGIIGISRCELAAGIYERITEMFGRLGEKSLIERYRELSIVQGKEIDFLYEGIETRAVVNGINDDGSLSVRLKGGTNIFLLGGEISLIGELDYIKAGNAI